MAEAKNILSVVDLHTSFITDKGEVQAVNGVSFDLTAGKIQTGLRIHTEMRVIYGNRLIINGHI